MIKSPERNATSGQSAARMEVRWLKVEALEPDKRNARVHSAKQVARIADSIAAFGFNVPILVDDRGGVLAGHGRLLAAGRLGLKEVPTITLDHLDEGGRRAFMIADNRLGELASWDDARLGVELAELKTLDLDFSLSATGFEIGEIDLVVDAAAGRVSRGRRLANAVAARVGRDQRSRLQPVARAGDIWALGPHRLVCGDESDGAAFHAVDASIRQWQTAAGGSASLAPNGKSFDAVSRERRRPKQRHAEGAAV